MPDPFDTGIRLTVVSDDGATPCSVDEFVRCPTNARADEWQRLAEAEAREHLATAKRLVEAESALAVARAALRHQPHEPPGRTAYVVSLEDAIRELRTWAAARIAHCAEIEATYLKTPRYDIPLEPVEARQEQRTLKAVLRVLAETAAPA